VTQQTVVNCFSKAGFQRSMCAGQDDRSATDQSPITTDVGDEGDDDDDEDDLPLSNFLPKDCTFGEYAAVDDAVETCELPSDDDIVESVAAASDNAPSTPDHEDDDDEEEVMLLLCPHCRLRCLHCRLCRITSIRWVTVRLHSSKYWT